MLATPQKVIVVPGYGMAVAQAQHSVNAAGRINSRSAALRSSTRSSGCRTYARFNERVAGRGQPFRIRHCSIMEDVNPEFTTTGRPR